MENIYQKIKTNINDLENIFNNVSDNDRISDLNQNALSIFKDLKENSIKELDVLKDNQEWNNFTIAFYGETNAGKSTLIEALRIYFKEKSKLEQEEQFNQLSLEYNERFEDSEQKIQEFEEQVKINLKNKESIELQLQDLNNKGIFFKILSFFTGNLKKLKKNLLEIDDNIALIIQEKERYCKEKQDLENKILEVQDGVIIGDGRSDFTKNLSAYNFTYNQECITLLDVPGIEGNEKIVIDEISKATKKAHAVFYIKREPTPPQKGNASNNGTIEKIQEHLSEHTEVYTIYNKPINNVRALLRELVNENEKESLKNLDEKMQEILHDNYKTCKIISAQIAFYGVSRCVFKNTDLYKQRAKFLEQLKPEELLQKSYFYEFVEFLQQDLFSNFKKKIKISNYNKALKVVEKLMQNIDVINKQYIKPLLQDFQNIQETTSKDLDLSVKNFILDLENDSNLQIEKFQTNTRSKMYKIIEQDITDAEFKDYFEEEIQKQINFLTQNMDKCFKSLTIEFESKLQKILQKFQEKLEIGMENNFKANSNKIPLNINIDSGLDKIALFGSLGGMVGGMVVAFTTFTGGWGLLALAVISGLIGVFKSIRKMFDKNYKRSQQKKSVDENLRKIVAKLQDDIQKQLKDNNKNIKDPIENIKNTLLVPITHLKTTICDLDKIKDDLNKLANTIRKDMI
ncbi:GTPase [Campylobacter insulaenigrae]|uniref:GTPase n=1 Tax=Campylobacter insulaenigrae TaxID=260714 RepID=UPI0021536E2F|nr:GTPase [Campylobacter insulaenigrae]MCR6573610.1 50S ribosome-binding GTPase [Campylobacter insulaenigrae]MCR6579639.1 50S ribosome-binding GTPase [Campylobacter insulaenigrae]MCR6586388.1 50S ribosome-binding GTPase [Campylobacter insulaenigrae]